MILGKGIHFVITVIATVIVLGGTSVAASPLSVNGQWIQDTAGRRFVVNKPFQRLISQYRAHTENLCALGAQVQVVGVSPNDDWPPEAKKKPVYSYRDDLEKFLSARPDLVLIRPMIERGYRQLVRRLETYGVKVVSLQPTTQEEIFVYWKILGSLTGRRRAAKEMIDFFSHATQRIGMYTTSIKNKKRVYFESIHDRMRTFAPNAMPIFVLETAGGVNVAHDAVPRRGTAIADFGKERILSRSDQIDVYLAQYGPMNHPTKEMIRNETGYGLIRAVKQGQIFLIDEKLVSRPTLRLLMGICRIGKVLYPDRFPKKSEILGFDRLTGWEHIKE